jgi:hypothetical protein
LKPLLAAVVITALAVPTGAQAAGVDAIAAYAGTWDVNVTHYQTKYSKPRREHSTLHNDCWRSADYYACDQIVDGQSRALLVFTYDAKQNVYHSYVIPQDGSDAHKGTLLISGSTWTYPMQDKDGGRTVYIRIVNGWDNPSTIRFRQEFSYDRKTWTLAASGIEHKTSP